MEKEKISLVSIATSSTRSKVLIMYTTTMMCWNFWYDKTQKGWSYFASLMNNSFMIYLSWMSPAAMRLGKEYPWSSHEWWLNSIFFWVFIPVHYPVVSLASEQCAPPQNISSGPTARMQSLTCHRILTFYPLKVKIHWWVSDVIIPKENINKNEWCESI